MRMNQKGFSMPELLIAVVVLALVAVPVYSSCVLAARYTAENDLRADCLRLAENEMELQKAGMTWKMDQGAEIPGSAVCLSAEDLDFDGKVVLDDKQIVVSATALGGECYAVTVTVSPVVEEGDPPFTVELKGVCVKK